MRYPTELRHYRTASLLDTERPFAYDPSVTRTSVHTLSARANDSQPKRRGASAMAIVRMQPVDVRVRTDWFDGTPREITWGEVRLPVTRLAAVRREDSAYRIEVGPRTVFEVDTPGARLALVFQHRTRRWTVDGVDDECDLSYGLWRLVNAVAQKRVG